MRHDDPGKSQLDLKQVRLKHEEKDTKCNNGEAVGLGQPHTKANRSRGVTLCVGWYDLDPQNLRKCKPLRIEQNRHLHGIFNVSLLLLPLVGNHEQTGKQCPNCINPYRISCPDPSEIVWFFAPHDPPNLGAVIFEIAVPLRRSASGPVTHSKPCR